MIRNVIRKVFSWWQLAFIALSVSVLLLAGRDGWHDIGLLALCSGLNQLGYINGLWDSMEDDQ